MSNNEEQPPPKHNDQPAVWDLVVEDMRERNQIGTQRYGVPLQAFNGRDPLVDAYQESLDKTVYLKQAIIEVTKLREDAKRFREALEEIMCLTEAHVPPDAPDADAEKRAIYQTACRATLGMPLRRASRVKV